MLGHTGNNAHLCDMSEIISRLKTLKRHVFIDTGVKPYTCLTCQRSFIHAYILRRHMLSHTGNNAHLCKICHSAQIVTLGHIGLFTWNRNIITDSLLEDIKDYYRLIHVE